MAGDRTVVTELATALGTLGVAPPVLAGQDFLPATPPAALLGVDEGDWARLRRLVRHEAFHRDAAVALANGLAFLASPDGLAGRRPRRVEWAGGRRLPGDEAIPADLRIERVYLVSCKYLSKILHNAAPARLFEGLLAAGGGGADWYERCAPGAYQALYETCRPLVLGLPVAAGDLDPAGRRALATALAEGWPPEAAARYRELANEVARVSAATWQSALTRIGAEKMLWRLLRVAPAPYFVLGAQGRRSLRLRIDTPWDWHRRYRLVGFEVAAVEAGQPTVSWSAAAYDTEEGAEVEVSGHVEVRWSHGRFAQPPEAKVYLDTPHHLVPGYHPLGSLSP